MKRTFPGTGHQSDTEAEESRLKRELEIVRQERNILRKGMASLPRRKNKVKIRLHSHAQRRVRSEDNVHLVAAEIASAFSRSHGFNVTSGQLAQNG